MSQQSAKINVVQILKVFASQFDQHLEGYLRPEQGVPAELAEAVRYAALAPGKRVRPFLLVRCCELAGGRREDAWAAAAAIECVHAFSLVHDDLPAMDDDDLRRGRLTTHKKFGEALGILAGDALVVRAFEIVAREYGGPTGDARTDCDSSAEQVALTPNPSPKGRGELDAGTRGDATKAGASGDAGNPPQSPLGKGGGDREVNARLAGVIALELARAAGWAGMIGGQADDLAGQGAAPSLELVRSIHARKTGKLFEASCRIGAMIGETTGGQAASGTRLGKIEGSRDQGIEGREEGTEGRRDEGTEGPDGGTRAIVGVPSSRTHPRYRGDGPPGTAETASAHDIRSSVNPPSLREDGPAGVTREGIPAEGGCEKGFSHQRNTGGQAASSTRAIVGVPSSRTHPRYRGDGPPGETTGGQAASGTHAEYSLVERLGRFGAKLGEAFQIADDVLDVTATAEELGKSPGKDAAANKQTYPRCVGVEASKAAAERAVREAVAELGVFGAEADDLRALAAYVVDRNY